MSTIDWKRVYCQNILVFGAKRRTSWQFFPPSKHRNRLFFLIEQQQKCKMQIVNQHEQQQQQHKRTGWKIRCKNASAEKCTTTTATTTSRATTTKKEYRLLSFMRLRDQVWITNWNVVQKNVHKSDLQIISRHLRVTCLLLWLFKISDVFLNYFWDVPLIWLPVLSFFSIIQWTRIECRNRSWYGLDTIWYWMRFEPTIFQL